MSDKRWDIRFINLAREVSKWSKDPSTKTGAVIVRPDRSISGIGYNGFPQSMEDWDYLYADREEKYSRIVHCEMNALMFSRDHLPLHGYTLYTWPFLSCDRCVVHMLQSGIKTFVAPKPTDDQLSRWGDAWVKTKKYIQDTEYGEWREYGRHEFEDTY
jgi:dCMP deaminase